jgi:hypothetical protein
MDPRDNVPPTTSIVPPPPVGRAVPIYPEGYVLPLVPAVPHPPVRGGRDPSLPAPPAPGTGASPLPPMVLWVLPLRGSSAPVGYIYDATPDPEGGLLAAALVFFSHQGHQVFHNPCPNLAEYCWAMGMLLSAVVSADRFPNHLLLSGLELMAGLCAPSPTDVEFLGNLIMAAYLSPTVSGPVLVRGPQASFFVGGPPVSLLAAAWGNIALPVSLVGGV